MTSGIVCRGGRGAAVLMLLASALPGMAFAQAQALPESCRVASVASVTPPTAGFSVSSSDENVLVLSKLIGETYQIVRFDRRTREERCLTCRATAGGPGVDRDKASPSILPGGLFVLMQVQMPSRAGDPPSEASWMNDIWMMSIDGERWWNLTGYAKDPRRRKVGVLPQTSADGRHVAWSERQRADGSVGAGWRLRIAAIETDRAETPLLRDIATVSVPGASVYEPLAWSRDGNALMFSADSGRNGTRGSDLWVHDVRTARTTPLPAGTGDGFGALSPGRQMMAAASADCCRDRPAGEASTLRSDLYLSRAGGGPTQRLTFFNERGHAHAKDGPDGSNVMRIKWSTDGRRLWFERRAYDLGGRRVQTHLAELTFAGACGTLRDTPDPGVAAAPPDGEVPPEPTNGRGGNFGINTTTSIEAAGVNRSFRIYVPASLASGQPAPVVLAFHGLADSNRFMSYYTGLDEAAEKHGFILVYPQARLGAWPLLIQWIGPDLLFFDKLIAFLGKHYNIDRNRIYATGMSNGAYFINLLASHRSTDIAAIAMHSGGVGVLNSNDIKVRRKYPVMIVHGTQDFIINVREGRHANEFYKTRGHVVQYVELPGHNHFWAYHAGINDRIWSFFQKNPRRT